MSIKNHLYTLIDFLRLPRPHGERRKSIYSPWGWGKKLIFKRFKILYVSFTIVILLNLMNS
jgi:hypothetical protein